jgi:hypothetical protein
MVWVMAFQDGLTMREYAGEKAPSTMRSLTILLLCASVSIAYSRPGETSGQLQQRFGAPLMLEGTIGTTAGPDEFLFSGHVTSRIHHFGDFEIAAYFYDNRSQREEFKKKEFGKIGKDEIEQIIKGASNGAPWTLESEKEGEAVSEYTKQRILERGLSESDRVYYKSKGLRASFEDDARGGKRFVVETDAFRALRLANKPQAPKSTPPKGKGF